MELMLDTCGFLSLVGLAEKKLTTPTLKKIQVASEVYISSCSLFEIAMKQKKKSISILPFKDGLALWEKAVHEYQLTELPIRAPVRCP